MFLIILIVTHVNYIFKNLTCVKLSHNQKYIYLNNKNIFFLKINYKYYLIVLFLSLLLLLIFIIMFVLKNTKDREL